MKKDTEKIPVRSSTRTLVLFCVVVLLTIVGSLCYRAFHLIKQSKFDGSSGFIVSITEEDKRKTILYAFDPAEGTVSVVTLQSAASLLNVRQLFGLPIDVELQKRSISSGKNFPLELTSYSLYNPKGRTDMSLVDSLRLWYLAQAAGERNTQEAVVPVSAENTFLDEDAASLFIDSQLEKDKKTIMIINGTAISGLGGRLERMIGNVGGSVISVSTSHEPIQESKIIYYGDDSYTVKRLQKIVPFSLVKRDGASLSDIIIEIGEDQQRTDLF